MRSNYRRRAAYPPTRSYKRGNQVDGFGLAALAFLIFLLLNALADGSRSASAAADVSNPVAAQEEPVDPLEIDWPYEHFVLTQGPHGQSYGHLAVDITAGKGADILSPITGEVTQHTVDYLGNTTLVLENDHFQVTLLHGLYDVSTGASIQIGERIGEESNQGFTVDFQGRLCSGRDCGYHTHLNIFDKQLGMNVNPLDVLPPIP